MPAIRRTLTQVAEALPQSLLDPEPNKYVLKDDKPGESCQPGLVGTLATDLPKKNTPSGESL